MSDIKQAKEFLESLGGSDFNENKREITNSIIGNIATDECSIEWANEYLCGLDEFVDKYTINLLKKVCNVLDTFDK